MEESIHKGQHWKKRREYRKNEKDGPDRVKVVNIEQGYVTVFDPDGENSGRRRIEKFKFKKHYRLV